MLRIFHYSNTTQRIEMHESAESFALHLLPEGDVVWIDLQHPSPEVEKQVFQSVVPIHPLSLEDVTKPRREPDRGAHLPKVEEFQDYLFVIMNPLCDRVVRPELVGSSLNPLEKLSAKRLNRETNTQLSAVITRSVLVTHHYEPLCCVDYARHYLERHEADARRGPDYIFHLILDSMVDEYAPVIDRVTFGLDRVESRIFRRPSTKHLSMLLRLKRHVLSLRKTLIYEREVLARLTRGEFKLVDGVEIAYYRNVYDHLVRYTELIESGREMISDLMQTHLSAMSNRLNEVMKVLAMVSTVILPMTLIAGVYGMNFEHMPELKWHLGYPFALGLMAITAVGSVAVFRYRRWF